MRTFLSLLALVAVSVSPALAHSSDSALVEHVRKANQRFSDVQAAVAEGYAPIPCASGQQGGAMGVHYVNAAFLKDGVIDIAKPEAVMYEPGADGKMTLVAVEYIAFKALPHSKASFSTSTRRRTATVLIPSTSFMSGRGSITQWSLLGQ